MKLDGLRIGLGITGSFCNFNRVKDVITSLKDEGATVIPILSKNSTSLDTRFYKAKDFTNMVEEFSENKIIDTIQKAEPIGPKKLIDIMVICPCTGNSLGKLANGITDTPVLMGVKSILRNNLPVVIGVSTNDGLGASAQNIAKLLNTKNIYFVPFGQDDYVSKPKSLVLNYTYIIDTIVEALQGKQIQPILSKS